MSISRLPQATRNENVSSKASALNIGQVEKLPVSPKQLQRVDLIYHENEVCSTWLACYSN